MRIISGHHKGKRIVAPKKLPVRPTTDRAKESLFNILDNKYKLDEKKILDSTCITVSGNLVNKNKIIHWKIKKNI